VINSAYWLIGPEQYIAAGPARIKPVAMIEPNTMWVLRGAVVLGLPLLVLALGGLELLRRRR
jgi:hypothetical protein